MEDERRKKIEAGKLKFAKFKKRKFKSDLVKNATNTELPGSAECSGEVQENSESIESSSFESLGAKEECNIPNQTEMEPNLIAESSFQFSEGSDDALQLENANSQLVTLYNQKIESYQSTIRHRESIIHQLTDRLASAMSANEAADSAGSIEVRNLKQEISILHQQMREATEMIEKQKLEYRENVLNACGDGKHNLPLHKALTNEVSIQVESIDTPQTPKAEDSLESLLTKCTNVPEFHHKLSTFLKENTTQAELESIINSLGPSENTGKKELLDNIESIDKVLVKYLKFPEFSLKLSDFLKKNTTELELKNITNKLLCTDSTSGDSSVKALSKPNMEVSSYFKKMETLGVVTKMIESLANASTRTLDDSACSKFQSFFLQRLNSNDAEPDASENEGDINYAEVTPNQERMLGKSSCEFSSIEKMRGSVAAEDFSLVTDFLLEEMDKLSASVTPLDAGPRVDIMVDSLETELPAVPSVADSGDSDFQRFLLKKAELESRLCNLKKMETKLQDLGKSIHHTTIDSDILTNSEDNILFEEPALSCVSLLSLTDSEYKTEYAMTDSELNSRKVSFDSARPVQDNFCAKCEKYYELVREKYHDHMCIFKDALENNLSIEKSEAVKNLESEIEKVKLEKEKLMEENSEQIELLCQEQELKIQHLRQEYEKYLQESKTELEIERDGLASRLARFEEELTVANKQIENILKEKDVLFQELETLKSNNADNLKQEQSRIEAHLVTIKDFKDKLSKTSKEIQEISNQKMHLEQELEALKLSNAELVEELSKVRTEIMTISNEKSYLVQELEALKLSNAELVEEEKCKVEAQYISTLEVLKKIHEDEIVDLKTSFKKQLEEQDLSFNDEHSKALSLLETQLQEKELSLEDQHTKVLKLEKQLEEKDLLIIDQHAKVTNLEKQLEERELLLREQHSKISNLEQQLKEKELSLREQHSKAISVLEASHMTESATFQKKIEQLLEEKCELLAKTTQEYESILKKNHKALVSLCNHLRSKLNIQKERILNESHKSVNSELEMSFSDALDELNKSIEHGILKFLNQNYFLADDHEENFDETEYLPLEIKLPLSENDLPLKKDGEFCNDQKFSEPDPEKDMCRSLTQLSEGESDDFYMIREMNKLQEEFQKDVQMHQDKITELHDVVKSLKKQVVENEEHKRKLEAKLQEKENDLASKESELAALTSGSKNSMSGSQLSSNEIRSWQVDAARNNSRLLHVLSDLVQTFLDIERDINSHLIEHGLIPSRSGPFTQPDEETGHSVGSREDFASLSIGECPNLELVEDGPDLTPRTWDLFVAVGTYDTEIEGEDVVLGASRRLRLAVDHVLNLLTRALNNQQNQDLKLLLKRNEELSQELQEESLGRDAVHMELVTAESTIRKLEGEKQRLEDLNRDLKENQELLKREVRTMKNRVAQLSHEKEMAEDNIQMLQNQCELLASRLGDPEKKLLQENSKLSSEKQTVQKSLSKERQSFLDRLHHMEVALEELNAEKEAVVEQKCREIQDMRAEMEAMEKQLNSNKKFIDEQAQEREQEREEYIREMNRMQDMVREKEKIQSNEAQLAKDIESLEQLLRARIEDHQSVVKKKEGVENELRQSVDKIRDLHEVIEELESQLDKKCKIEVELRQKLTGLNESISTQEKIHFALGEESVKPRNGPVNGESTEQMESLKEQLASQSQEIEQMSQSQTLLHELRGQIHFLEAKVEQRARLLETMHLASSPVPSDTDNSPGGSQGSEQLQLQDGYEMSPRSIHWLEVRRLEEKIGRLIHVDEEISRKNKEMEGQVRRMKSQQNELQHENAALQERLSEQLLQISILKSHIDEEKHRCNTPQKSQAVNDKIEELHEAYEQELENNKKLISEMQEMQGDLNMLKEEIQKRDNLIAILQKSLDALKKEKLVDTEQSDKNPSTAPADSNDIPACYKLMLLEKNEEVISTKQAMEILQDELNKLKRISENSLLHSEKLEKNAKIIVELEKENAELKSEVEQLNSEVSHLQESLASAKEQVEMEQAQVETLCEEMANLSQNSIEDVHSPKSDRSTNSLERENTSLARRLSIRETQLKKKVVEISALSANVTRLELLLRASEKEVELEKVQVETLMQELGSLTGYQKRLEQDFNTIQEMMQQKERELATLHEETDAQMRLEGELETLERELEEHQAREEELRQVMQQMQMDSEGSRKDLNLQIEQWRTKWEDMQKSHFEEVGDLRRQIQILCRQLERGDVEDIDIAHVQREIMEASSSFGANDSETYGNLVYSLVKKAVDSKLNQIARKHEAHVNKINETWEQKIKSELSHKRQFKNHCEKLEKENYLLRETFDEQNQRLSSEKDAHWDAKLSSIENTIKHELKMKYEEETNNLKHSLEKISSEKSALETKLLEMNRQIKDLKKKSQATKNEMLKEFENKIASVEKQLMDKQQVEMVQRQSIERLREDLESQLKREKVLEDRHKEEMSNLNELFEKRWFTEMKKIQVMQVEELKKLKDSKEKTVEALCSHLFNKYEERLKGLQDEYALKIEEERGKEVQRHKEELRDLQLMLERRFEKEKKQIVEMKDKEAKRIVETLEKRYNKKMSELRRSGSSTERKSSSDGMNRLEEERQRLSASHKREVSELRRELETKYEEKLQSQLRAFEAQKRRLEEVNELMRESRHVASISCPSDSGSNRTTTPSSEMTSSDEASGSCLEDMMPGNQHLLVRKITQGGKRILSLVENSKAQTSVEREARLWLEERNWIICKISSLAPEIVENHANLKLVISNLVEELLSTRQKLIFSSDEINNTKQRCSNLEDQLNFERSKMHILVANLSDQSQIVKEFQTRLDSKSNEVLELKRILANENRLFHMKSIEKNSNQLLSENLTSSYDFEYLRSANEQRSAERFSMFLPEIDSMSLHKTVQEIENSQEFTPPPQLVDSDCPDAPVGADSVFYESKNISSMREELMEKLSNTRHSTSYDAKLHGLYWVYKRSLSYNKSLVYQKKYLLTLLKGFQVTEMATLAWLSHLNNDSLQNNNSNARMKGRRRFKSAALVIVALARMRYFVRRWRHLAKIPSARTVEAEVRSVFTSHLSPTMTPGDYHLSSLSLSSKSTSIGRGEQMTNSQTLINSRSDSKTSVKMVNTDTSLLDCVHRLKMLQKQLGLDQNLR